MKMANIDAEFDFMFSQPKKPDGVRHRLCPRKEYVHDVIC